MIIRKLQPTNAKTHEGAEKSDIPLTDSKQESLVDSGGTDAPG